MTKKAWIYFLIPAFFILLFAIRMIHLGADPPGDLSQSMGYIGDPGGYVHNARNKILFSQWEMDMWNLMHISPLPHFLSYLIFIFFGIGIAQMNLLPVIFSCGALLGVYFLLRKTNTIGFSLTGTALLGINYYFAMFSRIADRVMPMLFFIIVAIILIGESKRKKTRLFLGGMFCFLAFTVKGISAQIIPAILLGLLAHEWFSMRNNWKKAFITVSFVLSGMLCLMAIWLFLFYLPHKTIFTAYASENIAWLFPHSFREALSNFWGRPFFFFQQMPVVTILSSLSLLSVAWKVFASPKKVTTLNWICSFWLISNMIYFSIIRYHAARHFIPLIFPIIMLSVSLFKDLFNMKEIHAAQKPPLLFFIFLLIWMLFPVSFIFRIAPRILSLQTSFKSFPALLGICLGITAVAYLAFRLWPKTFQGVIKKPYKIALTALLICLSFGINGKKYLAWAISPSYDIRTISRDLGKISEHMVIGGLIGPLISLENEHEVHPYRRGYINPYRDFIDKFGITHVFPTLHAGAIEKKQYMEDFPDVMKKARLIARYPLWKTTAELYELKSRKSVSHQDTFEGETFWAQEGLPRYDPQASGGLAFHMQKRNQGQYIELRNLHYPAGKYKAVFRVKAKHKRPDSRISRLTVGSRDRKKLLASKDIHSSEFPKPSSYKDFIVPFQLLKKNFISFRIYHTGGNDLWIDKITIIPFLQPGNDKISTEGLQDKDRECIPEKERPLANTF